MKASSGTINIYRPASHLATEVAPVPLIPLPSLTLISGKRINQATTGECCLALERNYTCRSNQTGPIEIQQMLTQNQEPPLGENRKCFYQV